jgi:CheY-like chemotaxis protein
MLGVGREVRAATILVVDDSPGTRRILRHLLVKAGYAVEEAGGGRAALLRVAAGGVGLVITDLVMPEGEGLETIRSLRRDLPDLPVIAISGVPDESYLRMAKFLGARSALPKPITEEVLLAEVGRFLPAGEA